MWAINMVLLQSTCDSLNSKLLRNIPTAVLSMFSLTGVAAFANVAALPGFDATLHV
jgi:hypothetical protein